MTVRTPHEPAAIDPISTGIFVHPGPVEAIV